MSWTRSDATVLATLQDLVAIDSVNPALPGGARRRTVKFVPMRRSTCPPRPRPRPPGVLRPPPRWGGGGSCAAMASCSSDQSTCVDSSAQCGGRRR